MNMKPLVIGFVIAGTAWLSGSGAAVGRDKGQDKGQDKTPSATDKVRISGWALSMSNVATGANQTIEIAINGWSSPAQRAHLIQTFLEKKQDGLLRELEKQPDLGRTRCRRRVMVGLGASAFLSPAADSV
jgi:hypothetical protein